MSSLCSRCSTPTLALRPRDGPGRTDSLQRARSRNGLARVHLGSVRPSLSLSLSRLTQLTLFTSTSALAKAGYSVLQLDSAPYYGTEHASLSLSELHDWAREERRRASTSSRRLPDSLARISQRFALSLEPMILRAQGPGLDLLVRSRVASYLQFGLVGGVGLFQSDAAPPSSQPEPRRQGRVKRVPASKSDVFTDQTLSLVEKRRLTKLLLFAAGQDPLEHDPVLQAGKSPARLHHLGPVSDPSKLLRYRARHQFCRLPPERILAFGNDCRLARIRSRTLHLPIRSVAQQLVSPIDVFFAADTPAVTQILLFRPWSAYGTSSTPSGDTDPRPTS